MSVNEHPPAGAAFVVVPPPEQIPPGPPPVNRRTSQEPAPSIGRARWYHWKLFGGLDPRHLVSFCRQFASYLDAGVSLNRALESLRRQYDRTVLGPVIGRLQLAVRRGEPLTEAMLRERATFDGYFSSMMRVAEVRGSVPETLRMLSGQIAARERLIRQTKSALTYPAFVILLALTVATAISIFVLPPLVQIMEDIVRHRKLELPLATRLLIRFSNFILAMGWWLIPALIVGTIAGIGRLYRLRGGKVVLDEVLFRLPVLGGLLRYIDTARFCRSLSVLLDAGVDIGTSLELTADTLLLVPLRRAVVLAGEGIMEGETLSLSLEATRRFPIDLIAIMNSGEETGRLPEMLMMVADDYEERSENIIRNLTTMLQPVITVVIGGIVLFLSVAFFMGYTEILSGLGTKV
jgi:type IV pilus assembly protein PilC